MYLHTWSELSCIMEGYYEQEKDRQFGIQSILLRDLIFTEILGNPYINDNKKPKSVTELMLFPGEKNRSIRHYTDKEIETMRKRWKF